MITNTLHEGPPSFRLVILLPNLMIQAPVLLVLGKGSDGTINWIKILRPI